MDAEQPFQFKRAPGGRAGRVQDFPGAAVCRLAVFVCQILRVVPDAAGIVSLLKQADQSVIDLPVVDAGIAAQFAVEIRFHVKMAACQGLPDKRRVT